MKYFKRILILIALMMSSVSCERSDTWYRIEYKFDNTEYQSDFLNVYENSKWRSSHHKLDTVVIDGVEHEFAYGIIDEPANETVDSLFVEIEGYRAKGGIYKLDSVFVIKRGIKNVFKITPEMTWSHREPAFYPDNF